MAVGAQSHRGTEGVAEVTSILALGGVSEIEAHH